MQTAFRTAARSKKPIRIFHIVANRPFSMNVEVPTPSTLTISSHNQYESLPFGPTHVQADPLSQFRQWFSTAQSPFSSEQGQATASNPTFTPKSRVQEPEAMSLSTATASGIPSSRMVLLKEVDDKGFVFFTNYTSRKSQELLENPNAALCFYWRETHQQVRVVGKVEKLDGAASDQYYSSRPLNSRVGAWASPQSQVINENELQERVDQVRQRFGLTSEAEPTVPRPEFWGGWRVIPQEVEFWSGKPSRLHDRVRYTHREAPAPDAPLWIIERLAP